jgi:WD40 repeat protein
MECCSHQAATTEPCCCGDRATLKRVGDLKGPPGEVRNLAFSSDGKTLAASWDRSVLLWDVASRKLLRKPLTRHTDTVLTLAFSPDGKILATGSRDRTVNLWNPASGEPVGEPL